MHILCHRGIWQTNSEKNTLAALELAIKSGFGIETDIRDCDGELVISHDMPLRNTGLHIDDFLKMYCFYDLKPLLALNIKSDGLQQILKSKLEQFGVTNYFVFDMSIPDTLPYMRLNMPFALRMSEFEDNGRLFNDAKYVWLDAFEHEWYTEELILNLMLQGKNVVIVSPELHKRSHLQLWGWLKKIEGQGKIYLCTDFINEAKEFFNV